MSMEAYPFNGKMVYVISENDLVHPKKSGGQIRVCCPIHNSRARDASIRPWSPEMSKEDAWLAGWGHCHGASCHADFLVKEWNPRKARYITQKPVEVVEPKIQLTAKELEAANELRRAELTSLNRIVPAMRKQLQHPRAQAYLAQRGIAHMMDLLNTLEIGYIPPAEEWKTPPPFEMRKWCDRVVFPYTTAEDERGYAGRTLRLWTPGMDENEHKKVLDEHNKQLEEEHAGETYKYQVRRWEKTYRSGFFNMQAAREHKHVYLMEGTFDTLPALYEGIPNVIAVCGQHFDAAALPKTVLEITMAYDADKQGQEAAKKTKNIFEDLGREGIRYNSLCAPDDDKGKDWSERYRLHGREGIAPLLKKEPESEPEPDEEYDLCGPCLDDGYKEVRAYHECGGINYCESHYQALHQDSEPLTQEQVVSVAHRVAAVIPGGCEVNMIPPGYTIEDRARELAEERRERQEMMTCSSPDEFFERLERGRLKGFTANVPPEFLERAKQPRTYPAPFPRYGYVENPETGKRELKQVGMWSASIEEPAMSA